MRNAHLVIGEITKPQGVRGELKLRPITCDLGRFEDLKTAYLKRGDDFEEIHVRVTRIGADAVFFHMEGIDDRNAAERLRGKYLCVDRAHAVQLPPDTYFIADLIGCETFDTEGASFGHITDVLQPGANDVYEIEHGRLMVPALKRVLSAVDIENRRIVFDAGVLREVGLFED